MGATVPKQVPMSAMTLRDYFAAQALQAAMTDPALRPDVAAVAAYAYADAMLKARDE